MLSFFCDELGFLLSDSFYSDVFLNRFSISRDELGFDTWESPSSSSSSSFYYPEIGFSLFRTLSRSKNYGFLP